jgi:hypothetical protein
MVHHYLGTYGARDRPLMLFVVGHEKEKNSRTWGRILTLDIQTSAYSAEPFSELRFVRKLPLQATNGQHFTVLKQ